MKMEKVLMGVFYDFEMFWVMLVYLKEIGLEILFVKNNLVRVFILLFLYVIFLKVMCFVKMYNVC